MSNDTAKTITTNIVPVQGTFEPLPPYECINLIGPAGTPFFAPTNPNLDGVSITNSTINSTTIGATTPAIAAFTTASSTNQPLGNNDLTTKLYVDSLALGISWKQPVVAATLASNITLSGAQTIDTVAVVAGDRVLVKNQTAPAENGIYIVGTPWTRSPDANLWDEMVSALVFVESGTQAGSAWYCPIQPGGTLGVTAITWNNFSVGGVYFAGTGLNLSGGDTFNISNTTVAAASYGSASAVPTFTVNAQGQLTAAANTNIAIGATQITSGTIDSARLSGSYSGITGVGTLTDLTVSNTIVGSISGNAATATTAGSATTATTATNLAGGATGSIPYQSSAGTTTFLAAGSNGQVLTLAGGVPTYATPTTGTVTSVSGTGTVSGISLSGTVTSSGNLTLGGTLDLSAPPAIGGTTANTVRGTTVTATTGFVGTNFDAAGSGGGSLRTSGGSACLQWGGGGGVNVTVDGPINMNGANSAIQINPTGTGTVSIAPAGALTVNPTTASTMNNVAIGGTTPLAGTFTDLRFNGTLSLAGTTGTAGFVLTSNGASAPTWQANANGLAIADDTTTNATRYLTFTSATTGNITTANVASTKLQFNPSTGTLSSTVLSANSVTDSQGGSVAPISSVMRNRIINGAMVIDQRNNGASVTPAVAANTYITDRWNIYPTQASKLTAQQRNGVDSTASNYEAGSVPVGFSNSLKITSSSSYTVTAGDFFILRQFVEGFNFADCNWGTANAKPVTLSFWVRSSLTGTFAASLYNVDGTRSYPVNYTISSANVWEYKTITIAGDTTGTWVTNNGVGNTVNFSLGAGSSFSGTSGAWAGSFLPSTTGATSVVGTSGATFYITGVQLEVGTQATSFEYRQYGTELALCQRYYQTSFNWAGYCNNPGTSVGGLVYGSQFMRVVPTVSLAGVFNITDTFTADYQQSSANISATIGGSLNSYFVFMGNFTALTPGRGYIARMNPSVAYNPMTLSAEL